MTEAPETEVKAAVSPEQVKTPQALAQFLTLLDKQCAHAAEQSKDIAVVASVRARGLQWALFRAVELLERQEARITELELSAVKAVKVEMD